MLTRQHLADGADIEQKDWNGQTALMLATRNEHQDITKMLLENGANAEARDDQGMSAMQLAVVSGQPRAVRTLLLASVSAGEEMGARQLHHFCTCAYRHTIADIQDTLSINRTADEPSIAATLTALYNAARRTAERHEQAGLLLAE